MSDRFKTVVRILITAALTAGFIKSGSIVGLMLLIPLVIVDLFSDED